MSKVRTRIDQTERFATLDRASDSPQFAADLAPWLDRLARRPDIQEAEFKERLERRSKWIPLLLLERLHIHLCT